MIICSGLYGPEARDSAKTKIDIINMQQIIRRYTNVRLYHNNKGIHTI